VSFVPDTKERMRAVVPRWRSLTNTPSVETVPVVRFPEIEATTAKQFQSMVELWRRNNRPIDAVDIMDAGIASGDRRLVVEGAKRVIDCADFLQSPVVERANELLTGRVRYVGHSLIITDELAKANLAVKISRLKSTLSDNPRNTLAQVEIARLYCRLGQFDNAESHLFVALRLSPNDRFVLRAATRFYTMMGVPEDALQLLWRSTSLRQDPWLLSAELAAATLAKTGPRHATKVAERIPFQRKITRDFSELAAGWATKQEFRGASPKRVLKILQQTLSEPTENALAQGVWLTDHLGREFVKTFPAVAFSSDAHEAKALAFLESSDFAGAEHEASLWVADQPFQGRSFGILAYNRFVHLDDNEGALQAVDAGLELHSHDWLLVNTGVLAASLIHNKEKADLYLDKLEKLSTEDETTVFLEAARGMVGIAFGDVPGGVEHYLKTITLAKRLGRSDLIVTAAIYLLEMLVRASSINRDELEGLEREIERAINKMALTELRTVQQSFSSRRRIWRGILDERDREPELRGLFNSAEIRKELDEIPSA
jgi:tetratricopeptide (TPR) repeat protein